MEFSDEPDIGQDGQTDSVTAWIRMLAIGMIVLGMAFAAIDRYQLLPPLPEAVAIEGS